MMNDNDTTEEIQREVKNAIHGILEESKMHDTKLGRAKEFTKYYELLRHDFDEEVRNIRSMFYSAQNKGILAHLELFLGYQRTKYARLLIEYILRENKDPLVNLALKKCKLYMNSLKKELKEVAEGKEDALIRANEEYQKAVEAFVQASNVVIQNELAAVTSERKKRDVENDFNEVTEELSNTKSALSSVEIDQKIAYEAFNAADVEFVDAKKEFALMEKKKREAEQILSEATEGLNKANDTLMSTEKKKEETEEALNKTTKDLNEVEVAFAHEETRKNDAEKSLNETIRQMNKHAFISNGDYDIANTFDEDFQSLQKNADDIASAKDALNKATEEFNRVKDSLAPAEEKKRNSEQAFDEITKELNKVRDARESAERRKKEAEEIFEKATNDLNATKSRYELAQGHRHDAEETFNNINESLNKMRPTLELAEKRRKDIEKDLSKAVQELNNAKERLESDVVDHDNIKKNLDGTHELIIHSRRAAMSATKDIELFFQNIALNAKKQAEIMEVFNKEVDIITRTLEKEVEMTMNSLENNEFSIEILDESHENNIDRWLLKFKNSETLHKDIKIIIGAAFVLSIWFCLVVVPHTGLITEQ